MKVGLQEAWAGRRRGIPTCPGCRSDEIRYSRREYDGLWARFLRVRPAKCLACGAYFPIAARGLVLRAESAQTDLRLPFKPVELDRPHQHPGGGPHRPWWTRARRSCPSCGSGSVRAGQPAPGAPALIRRLELQDKYRCLECNADFVRLNLPKLLALGLALVLTLGGLSYTVMNTLGRRGRAPSSPTIKKGQIPPPPPPVFR